jgi:hypothetical protein
MKKKQWFNLHSQGMQVTSFHGFEKNMVSRNNGFSRSYDEKTMVFEFYDRHKQKNARFHVTH